ncbi:hypothetical protein [Streptomyces antimicrobicus]|uniref:PPE family domain-containing protein n=1 Tax=Streptomyces antimicrobicus TaxID=2883108 RepID=A0ABS8BAY4_9ACTN|nr:hypothetical protein [Streptomyces antimicrobicus]MCB5181781.1 hypothetical protein [Streptomyces antimicrobicus]
MATTNFEGHSHQELLAMISSVNAETVKSRGQLLKDAEVTITKIGNDLKNHRVEGWEGKAAEAFQEWVNAMGNATLRLGEYSKTGGTWMQNAAQTIIEVKANMPKYDTSAAENLEAAQKYHNDPDSAQIGREATSKLSKDRQEAIQQMTKLAQSYEASTTQMNRAEVPVFPPPPATFVPDAGVGSDTDIARPGGDGGTRYRDSGLGDEQGGRQRDTGGGDDRPGQIPGREATPDNRPPSTTVPRPDKDVDLDLDNVGTLPKPETMPGQPNVLPPTSAPPGGGPVLPPPVTLPPTSGPRTTPGPLGPTGGRQTGGLPQTSGPVGKTGGLPQTSGPVGKAGGLPPREGISGGRPVQTSGRSTGIPRSTVIGGHESGPMGRGLPGGGGGLGGPGGGQNGFAGGRRLASERGGIVGGRPPGAGGRSTMGGQGFTQGGSGLVRNQPTGGAVGPTGSRTPDKKRSDTKGKRPDYLTEDEETWQGDRKVVPPVID